ncbi:MAG: SspB family protein [Rhizobiaceae bacterium]
MNDRFHYDALVDDALRSVVRRVLRQVADKGLPGSHHFYISFRSTDPGVQLPEYLRAKYPEEMMIVLQHQDWDLMINDEFFEVTVSFNKQQERIKVPFAALSAFVDPSVRFGLQFDRKDKSSASAEKAEPAPPTPLPAPEKRPSLGGPTGESAAGDAKPDAAEKAAADDKPEDPASKIVKLDSFRKK